MPRCARPGPTGELTDEHWQWALAFVRHGGHSLTAYPDYQRVEPDETGLWKVPCRRVALRHRMSIGTIVSDASLTVKFWAKGGSGRSLGSIEGRFHRAPAPRRQLPLRRSPAAGAGREHDRLRQPRDGQEGCRATLERAGACRYPASWPMPWSSSSVLPRASSSPPRNAPGRTAASRPDGLVGAAHQDHLAGRGDEVPRRLAPVPLPFAGRHVHLGLASLLAWRMGQRQPLTFPSRSTTMASNCFRPPRWTGCTG